MLIILTKIFTGHNGWLSEHIRDVIYTRRAKRQLRTLAETFE